MQLAKAKPCQTEECFACIQDAKDYQKSLGFTQWHSGYPTKKTIIDDIAQGIGYVFLDGQRVLGYCCIIIGEEPAYRQIEGDWKTDRPYAVIHRMAFSKNARGKGLSKQAMNLIKEFCLSNGVYAIRVDTHKQNIVMQRVLNREGFKFCGHVWFDGIKLAYEWDK